MRRFVRKGRKLRERETGIFGGMDVRMGSMLFFRFADPPAICNAILAKAPSRI